MIRGRARVLLEMARNAAMEPGSGEVFVALPEEKRAVVRLEKAGLVTVRRTDARCAGHLEWWFRLASVKP